MKIVQTLLGFLVRAAVFAIEAVCWAVFLARGTIVIALDARRVRGALPGRLRCPRGHEVEDHGLFECAACGFHYEGSVWLCPNPECPAPITSFVHCADCNRSVRNPLRWG